MQDPSECSKASHVRRMKDQRKEQVTSGNIYYGGRDDLGNYLVDICHMQADTSHTAWHLILPRPDDVDQVQLKEQVVQKISKR